MARYLLDTNTLVYIRQRRPAAARARLEGLSSGDAALSVISYGELVYGVEKSPNRVAKLRELEELVALIPVLPLPAEAGGFYGGIRAALATRGEMIGSNDLWIAAHACAADLVLVTNNEREFRRVPGLKIENWAR
jgi:tRNA(fMet)-specific endonuclease VapC